jgi:hypothetical protein
MRVLNVITARATSQGMRVVVELSPFLLIFFYPGCVPRVGEVQQDDHLHQQEQARAKAGQLPCTAQAQRDEAPRRRAECDKPSNCLDSATWSRPEQTWGVPLRVTQLFIRTSASISFVREVCKEEREDAGRSQQRPITPLTRSSVLPSIKRNGA